MSHTGSLQVDARNLLGRGKKDKTKKTAVQFKCCIFALCDRLDLDRAKPSHLLAFGLNFFAPVCVTNMLSGTLGNTRAHMFWLLSYSWRVRDEAIFKKFGKLQC